jgi:hypothetical protein
MTDSDGPVDGPHQGQPLVTAGTDLADAEAALVLVHDRGATARSILPMAETFHRPGVALLAPQAANGTWYPRSFLERVEVTAEVFERLNADGDTAVTEGWTSRFVPS